MSRRGPSSRRWRTVAALSVPLMALYLVFMLCIAFDRSASRILLLPGVTLPMLLAALLIAGTWLTTWAYVRWADRHLDQRGRQPDRQRPA